MQDEQGRKQGTKVVKQKSLQFIQTKNKKKGNAASNPLVYFIIIITHSPF